MIEFLKVHKRILLKGLEWCGIAVAILTAFYILDVKHSEEENHLKYYIDSTNASKLLYIEDANKHFDSIKIGNLNLIDKQRHVKSLNHNALQHYIDSITRTK